MDDAPRDPHGRRDNLLANGALTGTGLAPTGWSQWNDGSHDPCTAVYSAPPAIRGSSGRTAASGRTSRPDSAGRHVKFGGCLYTPGNDRLRNGTKNGVDRSRVLQRLDADLLRLGHADHLVGHDERRWIHARGDGDRACRRELVRVIVRCNDYTSGDGKFMADDVFLRNALARRGRSSSTTCRRPGAGGEEPRHGEVRDFPLSARATSRPDGDGDGEMDVLPWKWRYDIFGSMVRDYFGVQPPITGHGTNAYLCLAGVPHVHERRDAVAGQELPVRPLRSQRRRAARPSRSRAASSPARRSAPTSRAGSSRRTATAPSFTLEPDGQEMLLAYTPGTNRQEVVQIAAAPSVVHPGGDRVFTSRRNTTARSTTDLRLKVAFKEAGDNGDGVTNEIYPVLTNMVAGSGRGVLDVDPGRTDRATRTTSPRRTAASTSSARGSRPPAGVKVAQAVPRPTMLEWGVRPTSAVATNIAKGGSATVPVEWEELYESLSWQNTPLTRNSSFPTRVAVLRSSKTEAQYAGHFRR